MATTPANTFTRMNEPPAACATASAARASFRSTFTPSGRSTAARTASAIRVITAMTCGATGPPVNGASP